MNISSEIIKKVKIFVYLSSSADVQLIANLMGEEFDIVSGETEFYKGEYELMIVDIQCLLRIEFYIREIQKHKSEVFLPLMVLVGKDQVHNKRKVWELANEIIEVPISREIFQLRVNNLLKTRTYSKSLKAEKEKIEGKNSQLKLYYEAINSSISGLIITDPKLEDNPIIFCNKAFSELTGYTQEEILGLNCRFLQGEDDNQNGRDLIRKALKKGKPAKVLLRNYKKDGTLFWNELKISPIRNKNGDIEYNVGIQNDVTDLIESQQKLQRAKNQWETILEQSPNMIQISVAGIIRFINKAGVEMYGVESSSEIIGTRTFQNFGKDVQKKTKERMNRIQNGEKLGPMVYSFLALDGQEKHLKVQSIAVEYEGEMAVQTVSQDISEILNAQKDLKKMLLQKEVLLQEVHHRVKNNLAVIIALIELQKANIDSKETLSNLDDTQMRIMSIAEVHEAFYQENNVNEIDFTAYINAHTSLINDSLAGTNNKIHFIIEAEEIRLSLNKAVSCSLLISELISISQKLGFTVGGKKEIKIVLKNQGDFIKVNYSDNGIAYGKEFSFENDENFGLTVIKIMLSQIEAKWNFGTNNGLFLNFEFQKSRYNGPIEQLN